MGRSRKNRVSINNEPAGGKTEQSFKLMFEQSTLGMAISDKTFRFVATNPAFCAMLGYTEAELSKLSFEDIIQPENVARDAESIQKLARGEIQSYKTEKRYITKSGAFVYGSITVTTLHDANGKHVHNLVVLENITQRKLAEELLRKSEEQYRRLVETTGTGYVIIDGKGIVLNANREYVRLSGHEKLDEILGRSVVEWTAADEKETNARAVATCMENGSIRNFDVTYVDKTGKRTPVEINATVIGTEGKHHILTLCRDITERKQAAEALNQSRERYRLLHEYAPVGILLVNRLGQILEVNASAVQILGSPSAEATRTINLLAFPLLVEAGISAAFRSCVETGRVVLGEYPYTTKWGRSLHMLLRFVPIFDDRGQVNLVHTIVENVTERKHAENSLRESEEKYRVLFEGSPLGILAADVETGAFVVANPSMCRMLGYSEPEIMQLGITDIYPKDALDLAKSEFELMVQHKKMMTSALPCLRKEGSVLYADITAAATIINGRSCMVGFFSDVTDRRKAEEALRRSEERFSKAFKTSPYSYVIARKEDGRIIEVNDAFTRISGFSREEALAGSTLSLGIWVDQKDRQRMLAALDQNGVIERMETRLRAKNGEIVTALLFARMIQLGDQSCILSIMEDITERKQAEEALRESEENFRVLFNESPMPTLMSEMPSGKMNYVNKRLAEQVGRNVEDIIGKTPNELNLLRNPDDQDKLTKIIAEKGYVDNVELEETMPDGALGAVSISMRLVTLRGKPHCMTIIQDITERKRMEEALQKSEQKYRELANTVPVGIFEFDFCGKLTFVNKTLYEWFGYTEDEVRAGVNILDLAEPSDRQRLKENMAHILTLQSSPPREYCLVRKKGDKIQVLALTRPILEQGRVLGFRGILLDLTEKKKTEQALQNAAKLDALGVLAGGIAHDFNNLLTGIYCYMDLARSESKEPHIAEYFETMFATMKRAKALTLQLLTFSKGGSPVQKTTPLVPFIQETAQFALSGSNVSSRFALAHDLRPCNIDKDQIAQVIDNIVINAQQAMPSGGVIEISAANFTSGEKEHPSLPKGDYVKVSIRDFGIGIPKEIMPRIFDPFYTTKTKGHGLGLATCYSIVGRHGGCIEVDSEPGKGSTFHVYLPASSEPVAVKNAAVNQHRGSGTIIVMDDEAVVRDAFRKILELLGYTVECKNNGRDAVDFFINETAKRRFVAMIFDLTIPGGMGGMEAAAKSGN